ncbi:hypothetical protein NDU88_001453 [Pleurodeles waltl]|uniref:Uncharacterized protein n=1 Tax=Pleurodeles waltl TaxID=8319 RepID=A0AAV7P730_PLEWA|nr:hypothetical protein NDU88_001453 [Pleurodeles waltl]
MHHEEHRTRRESTRGPKARVEEEEKPDSASVRVSPLGPMKIGPREPSRWCSAVAAEVGELCSLAGLLVCLGRACGAGCMAVAHEEPPVRDWGD